VKLGTDDLMDFAARLTAGGDPFAHWRNLYQACAVRHAAYGFFAMQCEVQRPDCSKSFFFHSSLGCAPSSDCNFGLPKGDDPQIAQIIADLKHHRQRVGTAQNANEHGPFPPIILQRAISAQALGYEMPRFGVVVPLYDGKDGLSCMALWPEQPVTAHSFADYWAQSRAFLVLAGQMLDDHLRCRNPNILIGLSARELEALRCLLAGHRAAEICFHLGISGKTLEKHMQSARMKLKAHTRDQALAKSVVLGLVTP
jgi:DNA-binding CsgD family transcriptional regulator